MSDNGGQMVGPSSETIREIKATGRRWKIIFSVGYAAFLLVIGFIFGYAYWVLPPETVRSFTSASSGRIWALLGGSLVVWLVLMGGIHLHVLYSVWRARATLDDTPGTSAGAEETRNFAYLIEGDERAAVAAIRRSNLRYLGILLVSGILLGVALRIVAPLNHPILTPLIVVPWTIVLILLPGVCIVLLLSGDLARHSKSADIWLGRDFLFGGAVGVPRGGVLSRYADISRVMLFISKDRITGATIWTKTGVLNARFVKDPATVVRIIFEHTGTEVEWGRSSGRFSRMSRDAVKSLVDNAEGLDINSLLPPGAAYLTLDEFHANSRTNARGWKAIDFVSPGHPALKR